MKNNMFVTLAVAVVVAAGAFFGGMKYQESKTPAVDMQQTSGRGGRQRMGSGNGGGRVIGDVLSVDSKSITVKMPDGSTKIVLVSDTTAVTTATAAAKTDLKIGVRVGVFGTANSDGSVTAQNIQLNPIMMRFGTDNGQSGAGAPAMQQGQGGQGGQGAAGGNQSYGPIGG